MCGIAGIYSGNGRPVQEGMLRRMCDAMSHRGPDDEGYHVDGDMGMSMRRLSIIDLSGGRQPIHNEEKTVWVVFNGEIYNFRELRKDLEGGHRFYTNTDTEVIVHLYEEHGDGFVKFLNGMFTFALWDGRKRALYVGRDRLGIKPLYYTDAGGSFVFASEIKSILEVPYVRREVDPGALDCYFSFLYTPEPLTMFRGISKLEPGHLLVVRNGKAEKRQYWELEYRPGRKRDLRSTAEELGDVFRASVKRQLVSDVPLGAFLSGGIDSSAVVAAMSEVASKPVETFSIGYGKEEAYYDEREDARLIAERCGANHHEFELNPGVVDMVPRIVRALDEPLADASAIPNYFISRETRPFVKVALSGLGGDELCAGYPRYVGMYLTRYYRYIPRAAREKVIEKLASSLPDSSKGRRFADRVKRFVRYGALPPESAYFNMISSFDRAGKEELLGVPAASANNGNLPEGIMNSHFFRHEGESLLNRVFFTDMKMYLVGDLLTLTDKMSMAHSLEVRVPFLDNEMVEFMAGIPPEMKMRRLTKKYLFKKAFSGVLPDSTLYKEKKGFSVPLVLWFRNDLRDFIRHYLTKERMEALGYFNWGYVERLMEDHFGRRANYFGQLWALLVFCIWHRMYMENRGAEDELSAITAAVR